MKSSSTEAAEARDAGRLDWWNSWGGMTLGGLLLAAGPVVFSIAYGQITDEHARGGWAAGLLLATGVASTLGGAILVARLQHLSNKAARQSAMDLTKYNDALSGLHKAVGRLLNSDSSEQARREFFHSVVGSTSRLFPLEGVRVCVYELDSADDNPDKDEADQAALKYVDSGGRHDEPRKEFTNDSEHGRKAIETAQGTQHRCVVSAEGMPDVDRPTGSSWQSFMQVPLRLNGKALGLLSVDCRDRVEFTKDHVTIAHAAAALIVLGMNGVKLAAADFKPELDETMARIEELRRVQANSGSIDASTASSSSIEGNGTKDGDHDA